MESFFSVVSFGIQSGAGANRYKSELILDTFKQQIPADHLFLGDSFMPFHWFINRPANQLLVSEPHGARPARYPARPAWYPHSGLLTLSNGQLKGFANCEKIPESLPFSEQGEICSKKKKQKNQKLFKEEKKNLNTLGTHTRSESDAGGQVFGCSP